MKAIKFVVPAIILTFSLAAEPAADPFAVTLPEGFGAFTKQVQTTKSPEGDIETSNWIAKAPSGEAVIVTVSKMPGKVLDPQKLIEGTRTSLLKSVGATLETEEPRAGDVPSARLMFQGSGAFFRARLSVIDDHFYQLLYMGRSAEQRTAPAVGQMFDSFQIVQ
ncbi:MAG TPA: hypothetical protein VKB93_01210 [Thermoanaerobaculia bacterium]|nr:hypothetical protein [Thermoanaerobaculia bacterium]